MAHIRKQIRDAVLTTVGSLTTTGANVFSGRVYPAEETVLPCLLVYTASEQSEIDTISMGSRGLARQLELTIEGIVRETSGIDNTLDAVAAEVEVALAADPTLGGLTKDMYLISTTLNFSGEGNKQTGYVRFIYTIEYRTTESDPTTTI